MRLGLLVLGVILSLMPGEDRRSYALDIKRVVARRWGALGDVSRWRHVRFWIAEVKGVSGSVGAAWFDRLAGWGPGIMAAGIGIETRAILRSFARQPLFILALVVSLAVGIGVNAGITGLGWASLWAPLPFPQADRLVRLYHDADLNFGLSMNELRRYQRASTTLSGLAGWSIAGRTLSGDAPQRVTVARVTPNLFEVLGRPPASGRGFSEAAADEAIISHRFWTAQFGQSPAALGARMTMDGVGYSVVGVLPSNVDFPDQRVDIYTAIHPGEPSGPGRGPVFLDLVARMRPGATLQAVQTEVAAIAQSMRREWPSEYSAEAGFGGFVLRLRAAESDGTDALIWALLAGALLVLVATALNVATLLSSRARRRLTETRMRRCLGASDWHVLRGYGLESVLIGGMGGLGAAGFAFIVLRALGPSIASTRAAPADATVRFILLTVLAVTAAIVLILTAGAWFTIGRNGRSSGPGSGTRGGPTRLLFVASVAQITSAVILVTGSMLLVRTVYNLVTTDLGYRTDGAVTARVALPAARYPSNSEASQFMARLMDRLTQRPEVRAAGLVNALPLSEVEGAGDVFVRSISPDSAVTVADTRIADAGYFHAMGIPLLAGRAFASTDLAGTRRVVLIDEIFAVRFFGSANAAIGQPVRSFFTEGEWAEIVGVVGHTRHSGPALTGGAQLYVPVLQRGTRGAHVVVRSETDIATVAAVLRQELAVLDPTLPLFDVWTMDDRLRGSIARERLLMGVFAAFGLLATLLSSLGIYSVVRLSLDDRLSEIGIRRAIGASDLSIARLVASGGLLATAVGVPLGVVGSLGMAKLLGGMVFEIPAVDVASLGTSAVVVSLAGLLASLLPIRGASETAPRHLIQRNR